MKQLNINEATSTNQSLVEVLQNYGITFDDNFNMINLSFLNNGVHSKIFHIDGTDNVLKITDNEAELKAAEILLVNQNELNEYFSIPIIIAPINNNFFNEKQLSELEPDEDGEIKYENNIRYYLIYSKLHKLEDSHRKLFKKIEHYCEGPNLENYYALEDKKDWFIKYEIETKNMYKDIDYHYFIDWLIKAHKLLEKYGLSDVHDDNIMYDDNGDYKIIDVEFDN